MGFGENGYQIGKKAYYISKLSKFYLEKNIYVKRYESII